MRRTRQQKELTEAELRLPEHLQTYTGYGDEHGNYKWSERAWRAERNRRLGIVTPKRLHTSLTETLLADMLALCSAAHADDRYKPLHDQARALGIVVELALTQLTKANDARRINMTKARAARTGAGRKPKAFKLTDGQGHSQMVHGVAEVARLTGSTANSIYAQLSQGGGKAWLRRRDPEHSWTVERVGTETA